MTPSNANTSGLTKDLCERLDAILVEESPMHPFGCATWEESSRIAIDMAKDVIVTAASAQARIDAAEARADRLAKALEAVISYAPGIRPARIARAALQQEG